MSKIHDSLNEFVAYAALLKGDEKGEAQVFCDRLFKAFGHAGYKEAGATLEERIKKASGKGTSIADLVWKPRLLIEIKKGERSSTSTTSRHLTTGSTLYRTDRVRGKSSPRTKSQGGCREEKELRSPKSKPISEGQSTPRKLS